MAAKARKQKRVRETAVRYTPARVSETYRASITSKGQVVIPAALRRKYGITPKTQLVISEEAGRITIKPITHALIEELRGKYKGSGLLKALLEERAQDREREDAKLDRAR
jgi:AbrB family looped-hinge helix DNA binding protein